MSLHLIPWKSPTTCAHAHIGGFCLPDADHLACDPPLHKAKRAHDGNPLVNGDPAQRAVAGKHRVSASAGAREISEVVETGPPSASESGLCIALRFCVNVRKLSLKRFS